MTTDTFLASRTQPTPPADLTPALLALWQDSNSDWEAAHQAVQDDGSTAGAWVHAYLHRKEGDLGNAAYWYRRAGQPVATGELADEWLAIVQAMTTP